MGRVASGPAVGLGWGVAVPSCRRRPFFRSAKEVMPEVCGSKWVTGGEWSGEDYGRGAIAGEVHGRGAERGKDYGRGAIAGEVHGRGAIAGKRCESREGERLCEGACSGEKVPAAENERRVAVRPSLST